MRKVCGECDGESEVSPNKVCQLETLLPNISVMPWFKIQKSRQGANLGIDLSWLCISVVNYEYLDAQLIYKVELS